MLIPKILLDKNSSIPLYRQLTEALEGLIADGTLAPDTKLPSIRKMAMASNVNNSTVVGAYKLLESRRAVYTVVGSGTFVAQPLADAAIPMPVVKPPMPEPLQLPDSTEGFINFADLTTDADLFPSTAFRRAFDAALERDGGLAFGYCDSQGYEPLRKSMCKLLDGYSVKAEKEHIQIIHGAQQGLDLLAAALITPGDIVFIEALTSRAAAASFMSKGAQIIEMPMVNDGPDMEAVETLFDRHKPKLIYVMPNFQAPTGICYSDEKKRRLLSLAGACGAYIIEEDQFSDFYYDGVIRTPLKALDTGNRIIFIKSFSKILMPGLHTSFMVCPPEVIETIDNKDIVMSGYVQRGFDLYLKSGAYNSYCATVRTTYGRRYQKIVAAVTTYLAPLADCELPGGGLSLWITPHSDDAGLAESFLQNKVIVSPGRLYAAAGVDVKGFRLSFASVPESRIAEGIGAIAQVLNPEQNQDS